MIREELKKELEAELFNDIDHEFCFLVNEINRGNSLAFCYFKGFITALWKAKAISAGTYSFLLSASFSADRELLKD